ncbi:MAG: zf-TFIIB domain-containing protein [Ignavibacteriae bacterium]|nr:zf-TFIIB domain-containing protein [Ignavibacteriota bacterium]
MFCPSCKHPMIVLEFEEIETDFCTNCEGIWLDAGELELLLENSSEKDELIKSFSKANKNKEKKRRCPICYKKMDKTRVSDDKDIVLDECKHGHGLWFDKGEILEVIKEGSVNKHNRIIQVLEDMYQHKIAKRISN